MHSFFKKMKEKYQKVGNISLPNKKTKKGSEFDIKSKVNPKKDINTNEKKVKVVTTSKTTPPKKKRTYGTKNKKK